MKKICLLLLSFLSYAGWGQTADSLSTHGFTLGIVFSPDYGYRRLETSATDQWMKETYDTLEVPRFSYTAGLAINFRIIGKLSLSSGLFFSDKGERTKRYSIPPVNNYNNHYYYLDVPVKLNYHVIGKKIKLFLSAGVAANIYLNSRTTAETGSYGESKRASTGNTISRLAFSFVGGFGIDCPLTQRWFFRLEPNYRKFLTPIADGPVKKYLYSTGINLGFFGSF